MRNPAVWGIDPDTKRITIVTGPMEAPELIKIPLSPDDGHVKSCGLAFRGLAEWIGEEKERTGLNPVLYLEAPVVGVGGPGPTISQAQVGGALMAAAEEMETSLALINNTTWKKRVCGNGNFNKDQINTWVEKNWNVLWVMAKGHLPLEGTKGGGPYRDQNAIDAGCIYLFGLQNYELKRRILKRKANKSGRGD